MFFRHERSFVKQQRSEAGQQRLRQKAAVWFVIDELLVGTKRFRFDLEQVYNGLEEQVMLHQVGLGLEGGVGGLKVCSLQVENGLQGDDVEKRGVAHTQGIVSVDGDLEGIPANQLA